MSQKNSNPNQLYLVRALRPLDGEEMFMCIVRGDDETDRVLETGELHRPRWDWIVDEIRIMDSATVDEVLYEPGESPAPMDDDLYREWKATRDNPPDYNDPTDPRTSAFWENLELSRGDE